MAKDCIDLFQTDSAAFKRTYKNGKVVIYLRDAKIESVDGQSYLMLLLAVSDKRKPDEVISDPAVDSRREIKKDSNEGSEQSCHIVIKMTPDKPNGSHYSMAFEVVVSLGATFIHWYLRFMFGHISINRGYKKPNPMGVKSGGQLKDVPIRLVTELHAVPSDQLIKDLKKGELAEIVLSKEIEGVKGFDKDRYTIPKKTSLTLRPVQSTVKGKLLDAIMGVCKAGKNDYNIAKVSWLAAEGGVKKRFSADFACDSGSVMSDRYVKKQTFILTSSMMASCEAIDGSFSSRLAQWIK